GRRRLDRAQGVGPHPPAVERWPRHRLAPETRMFLPVVGELADHDGARLWRDPKHQRVDLLVVVPLLGVVPERIRILPAPPRFAEQCAETEAIESFALVVVETPG